MISLGKRTHRLLAAAIALAALALAYASIRGSAAEPAAGPGRSVAEAEALVVGKRLPAKMEAALGGAFGGAWFNQSSGQMHVGVTSPASRRAAAGVAVQAGLGGLVTETTVDSTWAQLEAAQAGLNSQLEDLFSRGEVKTGLLADENAVHVELGSAVSAARREALKREAASSGVGVSITVSSTPRVAGHGELRCRKFEPNKAYCDKPIAAGMRIISKANGTVCTAGPAIVLKDTSTAEKATATYILTAGHCIKEGGGIGAEWDAVTKEKEEEKLIGKAEEGLKGEKGAMGVLVDVGVIKVNKPGAWVHETETPVTPGVVLWDTTKEVDPTAVTTQGGIPMKGTKLCVSGQTSGTSCKGEVTETGVTQTFENEAEEKWTAEKTVEVEGTTTGGGTSGGPWFMESKPGEVMGTHIGAGTVGGKPRKWYQPLSVSFENLATSYVLLTTANEKRKHP